MNRLPLADRGLYALMAGSWLLIGVTSYTSSRVPYGGTGFWVAVCCIPAGVLVALMVHATTFAFRMYLWTAVVIGVMRGVLYVVNWDGSGTTWSPLAVWALVTFTTLLAMWPQRCRVCRTE